MLGYALSNASECQSIRHRHPSQVLAFPMSLPLNMLAETGTLGVLPLIRQLDLVFRDVGLYRRLLECQPSDAQKLLDSFQRLLDMPGLGLRFRKNLTVATQRISSRSGLYPACYELKDVVQTEEHPVEGGGFADIYKGYLKGRAVCMKTIRLYQTSRIEDALKQISREAILWGQLSHPNVLTILGLFRFHKRVCVVTEWMLNGDITMYLRNHPSSPRPPLVFDVAKGLDYLHSNRIIHGDIKGPNILIDDAGRALLSDFGISSVSDSSIAAWSSQSTGASKGGSTRWQAPELFDVENDESVKNTTASDVYAFGCVCYEIFTGEVPFATIHRDSAVLFQVKSGVRPNRPPPSSLSWQTWGLTEKIWMIMQQCWKQSPIERPSSAEIFQQFTKIDPVDTRQQVKDRLSPAVFRQEINMPMEMLTIGAINQILGKTELADMIPENNMFNTLGNHQKRTLHSKPLSMIPSGQNVGSTTVLSQQHSSYPVQSDHVPLPASILPLSLVSHFPQPHQLLQCPGASILTSGQYPAGLSSVHVGSSLELEWIKLVSQTIL
ncbi:putative serine/threonine-protein kinase [Termitomyces sp. J132]|nr:putative serine/threonine-protein kinase [Termitomyces sp. J132]